MGSLESFWYLFTDMWRGYQDCHARMQPTCVSNPPIHTHTLYRKAFLVDLVSILAAKLSDAELKPAYLMSIKGNILLMRDGGTMQQKTSFCV